MKNKKMLMGAVLLLVVAAIALGAVMITKVSGAEEKKKEERVSLLEMSAEETYQTLVDNGFVLPTPFVNEDGIVEDKIIEEIKVYVDYTIENDGMWYGYNEVLRSYLTLKVRDAVIAYEGIEDEFADVDLYAGFPDWVK